MKLKLKDACKLTWGGHSPLKDDPANWDNVNGKLWLRVRDLKDQTFDTVKKLSNIGVELTKNHKNFLFKKHSAAIAIDGSIGKIGWLMNDFYASGHLCNIYNENKITNKYLYYFLLKNQNKINSLKGGTSLFGLSKSQLKNFEIDLPDFEKQKKIVQQLDSITKYLHKIIEEKQKIIKIQKFFIEQKIRKNKNVCVQNKIKLKNICKLMRGRHSPKKDVAENWDYLNGKPWLRIGDLKDQTHDAVKKLSNVGIELIKNHNQFIFKKNSVALAASGSTIGRVGWLMNDFYSCGDIWNISNQNKITNKYLYHYLAWNQKKINSLKHGTGQLHISKWQIENLEIDLPDFEKQKQIVEQLDILKNFQMTLNKEEKIVLKIKKLMLQHKIF